MISVFNYIRKKQKPKICDTCKYCFLNVYNANFFCRNPKSERYGEKVYVNNYCKKWEKRNA